VGEDQSQTGRRRLTVAEASEVLGITVEAVRGRIKRGTLEHERDSGTVYVLLDADQSHDQPRPEDDQTSDRLRPDDHADITEELRDRIRYLERQVEEEREARRRADTILAQLSAANAEQARTIRALEAPQEAPEDAETVEEASDGAEPRSPTAEAQDELGAERARREMAESTLREGMAEQRRRREEAERERDDLRRELYARREPRESPDSAAEASSRAEPQSATVGAQEGTQRRRSRPWWRRIIGG
jgi:superfamily II RNA helicase